MVRAVILSIDDRGRLGGETGQILINGEFGDVEIGGRKVLSVTGVPSFPARINSEASFNSNTGSVFIRSTAMSSDLRLVGSIHCRSSKIISTRGVSFLALAGSCLVPPSLPAATAAGAFDSVGGAGQLPNRPCVWSTDRDRAVALGVFSGISA